MFDSLAWLYGRLWWRRGARREGLIRQCIDEPSGLRLPSSREAKDTSHLRARRLEQDLGPSGGLDAIDVTLHENEDEYGSASARGYEEARLHTG